MDSLGTKELRDILRIIEISNCVSDRDLLGREVVEAVSDALGVEKCMFILQEEGAAKPDLFFCGIERSDVDRYMTHFYSQDPLGLLSKESDRLVVCAGRHRKSTVSLQETVSYREFVGSEYYNEFYRPQGIFHEIATPVECTTKLTGVIDLLRSERDRAFSPREMQVMDVLAPHIARAVDRIEVRKEMQVKDSAIAAFEDCAPGGLVLCDDSLAIVYASGKAKVFCRDLTGSAVPSALPKFIQEDLAPYVRAVRASPGDPAVFPKRRSVRLGTASYELEYGLRRCVHDYPQRPLVSISIRARGAEEPLCYDDMKERFGLTKREFDIVACLIEGRTNGEIGEKLFISEFTVKKHLQNICEKLNVKSRTAILSTVLKPALQARPTAPRPVPERMASNA